MKGSDLNEEPRALVMRLKAERYPNQQDSAADAAAAAVGDADFLIARIRALEQERDADQFDLHWMAPDFRPSPRDALRRIKAICTMYADPCTAIRAVAATHPSLSREHLAEAIKQFRTDLIGLDQGSVVGLLVAVVTSSRQAFDSVMRARKAGERKAAAVPWVSEP